LRRDPDTKTVPVVIVSADATPEQMDRLLDSGAQSYVTKPIDIASMLRLLDSVLEDGARGTDDRFLSSVIELP
jgi:CheY-like chemotaxis protein